MKAIFRYFSLRHLLRHKLRTLLAMTAVALGVSLYVSSDITNSSVTRSFEKTLRDLAGKAEWQVTRGRMLGVDEPALDKLRSMPGVVAAPIIQSSVALPDLKEGTLLILGIDFWRDSPLRLYKFEGVADPKAFVAAAFVPDAVVVTRRFADRHSLKMGGKLKVATRAGIRDLRVTGILENEGPARVFGGNLAVMEIHAAQKLFGKPGQFDRIEVAGTSAEALRAALGPDYAVEKVVRNNSTLEDALARIQSLVVVSIIALLVGVIIIYQTVSISVVERVREIGILRSLGATRGEIQAALVAEWSVVGLVGAAVGIGLGYGLARALVEYTSSTINAIVMLVDVRTVELTPVSTFVGLAAGTLTAVIAAFHPARKVSAMPVVELLRSGIYGYRHAPNYWRQLIAGLGFAILGSTAIAFSASDLPPYSGLLASILVFIGVALALPQATLGLTKLGRPLLRMFSIEGFLASDNAGKFPQRTALTVVCLGGALAMMVSTATLIRGFDIGTHRWMDEGFPFDLTVSASDFSQSIYGQNQFPETVREEITSTEGVGQAYGVQKIFTDFRGMDVMLLALDTEPYVAMRRERGMDGWSPRWNDPDSIAKFRAGEAIFVSENLAAHFRLKPGDSIELPTPSGPKKLSILDAVEDYSWPRGLVILDRRHYRTWWNDRSLTYVDFKIAAGADRNQVRSDVSKKLAGRYWVFLYDVADLKRVGDETLRHTVQLANMQVVIAIVIGFLGIVNTLLISVLSRTREIGLLRAIGLTRGQTARTIVIEAVLVASAGGVLGVLGGLVGAAFPLRYHTYQITGFMVPFEVPWPSVLLALGTAVVVGFAASALPASRAARLEVLKSLSDE